MALTVSSAITEMSVDLTTATTSQIVTAIRDSVQSAIGGTGSPIIPAHIYGVTLVPVSNTKHRILILYD